MDVDIKIPIPIIDGIRDLPKTKQLYYDNPYLKEFDAEVLNYIRHKDTSYIVLDRTCFFPEGGGQKGDSGTIRGPSSKFSVVDTQEVDDVVLHITLNKGDEIKEGDVIQGCINWDVRYERMKQHTASHLIFSAIKKVLDLEELTYMGVQIREDTSRIDISYGELITKNQINNVERLSNQASTDNRKVINWLSSRKEIEEKYGKSLGLTEITPSGYVRVVEVQGGDIALCSGTHVESTAEIGLITILDKFRLKKGVERIEFTAGKQAYRSYNDSMKALKDTAQTLSTSISKVPVRVKNLLKERDKLKKLLSNLQDQLIEFNITKLQSEAPEFEGFKLLIKELPPVDSQKLKKIAVKLTEKDPYQIVVLGTKTEKSAFLVGAIGEAAVRAGLDIGIQINNVARILKGGGGGNQRLAQAGGKAPEKINEALELLTIKVKDKLHKAKKY